MIVSDIEKLLQQSDKAELLEWIQEHLSTAEKCFIAVATPDGEGGLIMSTCQVGHQYQYELAGFVDWIQRFVDASREGGGDEGSEGEDEG